MRRARPRWERRSTYPGECLTLVLVARQKTGRTTGNSRSGCLCIPVARHPGLPYIPIGTGTPHEFNKNNNHDSGDFGPRPCQVRL